MSALPAESQPRRLGEILIARGKVDAANLERALRLQEGEPREKLGVILNRLGLVSARDLAEALSERLGIAVAAAAEYPELPLLEERVSDRFLRDARALPLRETDEGLVVAMADPADGFTIRAIEMASGKRVVPLLAVTTELESGLESALLLRAYAWDLEGKPERAEADARAALAGNPACAPARHRLESGPPVVETGR